MRNKITVNLADLVASNIISQETAEKISRFYQEEDSSQNKLIIVFGILGAILVGLGIILILAHNWDEMPRALKTFIAFVPMLVGQGLCAYTLFKKQESITWREGSAIFLFIAVGACISLISQIYNIPGKLSSFLLTWMLLCLPLVYVMRSSIASLAYLVGITYYASEIGYWTFPNSEPYIYWLLLLLVLPHYYYLYKNKPWSNSMLFHNWLVPLSITITLGTVAAKNGEWLLIAYVCLFGLFYLTGKMPFFKNQKYLANGYAILGSLGTVGILLAMTFDGFWKELVSEDFAILSPGFFVAALLFILAAAFLFWKIKNIENYKPLPLEMAFIVFAVIFATGLASPILATVLVNIFVFAIGLLTIRQGADMNHLGILNYGLLIITALVICRFFDTNIPFVFRGILFLLIGTGFFLVNFWMLKKRKEIERNSQS